MANVREPDAHAFVVRIWLEETREEAGKAIWRGHVTHVLSGERRYLKDLDDILAFIVPYLDQMGVEMGVRWRMKQWLGRRRRRWKRLRRTLARRSSTNCALY